ncbi:MAG TPA: LysR family transcriptional regulator, partial [Acidimicrobiales bacterium]|nr:LysR family transcriptional regulator [Acidimicrobiales bacterium]
MTLTQLEAFVLVARLGSVKAAAQVLGVSEPAVSGALAALRQHLGDPLVARAPGGMNLTPGGQRLVPIASQMVNLAVEAEGAIRRAQGAPELLRVVATSAVAEYVARPLLTAFTARHGPVEATLGVTTASEMPALLHERLADVGLGPPLPALETKAMMRYRLVVVAGPRHCLARSAHVGLPSLAGQDWLVDASG